MDKVTEHLAESLKIIWIVMTESGLTQEVEPKNLHMYLLPSLLFHILNIYATQTLTLFLVKRTIMVNFMCHLNWTTRCLDIWLNAIQVCLWGWFWMRLKIASEGWVKQTAFTHVGDLIPSMASLKSIEGWAKRKFILFAWLWMGTSVFFCLQTQTHTLSSTDPWAFECRSWDISVYNHMSQFLIYLKNYLSLYLSIIYLLSLYLYLYISISILIL